MNHPARFCMVCALFVTATRLMPDHHYSELRLLSADGTPLFAREWRPAGPAKAWVTLSHGTSEHSGRYAHVAKAFDDAGVGLVMADLRGSGQSPGKRGHIERFSQYCDDVKAAIRHTQSHQPAVHFLGGHSLGGLIAACIATENPEGIDGVFLSCAAFQLGFAPAPWKLALSRVLATLRPSLPISNEIDVAQLSRDASVGESQQRDPYNHGKVTPSMFLAFIQAQQQVMQDAPNIELPMLVMHGGADAISACEGSERFFAKLRTDNKALKIYDGMYHEIFNELGKEQVFSDVLDWMAKVGEQ